MESSEDNQGLRTLIVDLLWVAICDLHAARRGERPSKSYRKWLSDSGYSSPLQEIEEFWRPNAACSLYLGVITDIEPEEVAKAALASSEFPYRQKLSVSSDTAAGAPWKKRKLATY